MLEISGTGVLWKIVGFLADGTLEDKQVVLFGSCNPTVEAFPAECVKAGQRPRILHVLQTNLASCQVIDTVVKSTSM